jgi:hypothetical protein
VFFKVKCEHLNNKATKQRGEISSDRQTGKGEREGYKKGTDFKNGEDNMWIVD